MCAVHGGIRVDVFARILFQQVAVKHLKEVEPCCTRHKTSSRLAALQCQIPEFRPRAPRASRAQGGLDGACSRHEFPLLLSPAHSRVIHGPFTGKRHQACQPLSKQSLGASRSDSAMTGEETEQPLKANTRGATAKQQFGAVCVDASSPRSLHRHQVLCCAVAWTRPAGLVVFL